MNKDKAIDDTPVTALHIEPIGEEDDVTDIEIMPDGRIYVFGMSPQVATILESMTGGDVLSRQQSPNTAPQL